MSLIRTTCKNPKCGTPVLSDSNKWNPEKEIITIVCPKCKQPIEKHINPKHKKKGTTEFIPKNAHNNESSSDNFLAGWLVDKNSGQYFQLQIGRQTIGRMSGTKDSDIKVPNNDLTFSGAHCLIEATRVASNLVQVSIRDNGSKNGIILNNEKRLLTDQVAFLKNEDRILMGRSQFVFLSATHIKDKGQVLSWITINL